MRVWRRPAVRWTVLALLGVVIATAVTIAATRLVAQHVALGGEPRLSDNLVASPARSTASPGTPVTTRHPASTAPTTVTTTRAPAPSRPDDDERDGDADDD